MDVKPSGGSTSAAIAVNGPEASEISKNDRVYQGDIIEWHTPEPPWRLLGLIITADCDIVQNKHGATLSYVPVVPLHVYWQHIAVPKKVEKYLRTTFRPALRSRINALARKYVQGFEGEMSEVAIEDLLAQEPKQVMEALSVPDAERAGPTRHVLAYQASKRLAEAPNLSAAAWILAEMRAAPQGSQEARIDGILEDLASEIGELPADAFFFSGIAGKPRDGFVAYLRYIREMDPGAVAMKARDLRSGTARRVAHLESPYVYRLTQQLAQVFSDIGLPKAYEASRDEVAKNVRDQHGSPRKDS